MEANSSLILQPVKALSNISLMNMFSLSVMNALIALDTHLSMQEGVFLHVQLEVIQLLKKLASNVEMGISGMEVNAKNFVHRVNSLILQQINVNVQQVFIGLGKYAYPVIAEKNSGTKLRLVNAQKVLVGMVLDVQKLILV